MGVELLFILYVNLLIDLLKEVVLLTFCSIDLNKAFDKLNHSAVHMKHMKRNTPFELLGLLENWLSDCLHVLSGIAVGRLRSESPQALDRDRFCHYIFLQYM